MNEKAIREIIELVNKLQNLGCGVETDNEGQILVYTGLEQKIIELVIKLKKLGCGIETDNDGQMLVYTGLEQNDNGEIVVCE